jgi:DNA-binding response OmpR family regulator
LELSGARLNKGVVDFAVRLGREFMAGVHSARATTRFGVFEADFRAGELRKRGVKVKLQEQPLQILQMLLEHPGDVVTREELQKKIWPGHTFVDFEQGLYNAVRRLRDALKDSAEKRQTNAARGNTHSTSALCRTGGIRSLSQGSLSLVPT